MQILLGDFPLDFCRLRMSLLGKEEKGDTDSYLETVKAGLPRYFLKSILHIKGGQKVGFRHSVPGICYIYLPAFIIKQGMILDRKSTRLNSSHVAISYAVFCLKKKR